MKLAEARILQALNKYFEECDADELARITGDIFGGACFPVIIEHKQPNGYVETELLYDFEPTRVYGGEFMDIDPTIKPDW